MAPADRKDDLSVRGLPGRRMSALAARVAVVLLAFHLTIPMIASGPLASIDAPIAATVAGALLIVSCGALALLTRRNRALGADRAYLEAEVEELRDRNWELKELAERSRAFLETLGDVIVRRDSTGRIVYANDA